MSDGNTDSGRDGHSQLRSPPLQSLALAGASSIEEIMTILPSVCLKPLKGRFCACFSSTCVHAYSARELRTHTLSGLPSIETGSYADSASSLVSESLFRIWYCRSSCIQRLRTFLCERAKGWENRRRLGVCVSVGGTVKCGWNLLIRPHRSLRWAVQLDSEL